MVYERLLNLAVPPDPDDKGIKLEDCLEEYFNTTVDVLRDHEESKKGSIDDSIRDGSATPSQPNPIRLIRGEDDLEISSTAASPMALTPSQQSFDNVIARTESQASTNSGYLGGVASRSGPAYENESPGASPNAIRTRSASVIQRVVLDEHGRPTPVEASEAGQEPKKARRKGSTVVKAVTIPAWQFFRLIRKLACV